MDASGRSSVILSSFAHSYSSEASRSGRLGPLKCDTVVVCGRLGPLMCETVVVSALLLLRSLACWPPRAAQV